MSQTLVATAGEAPREANLAFDRLYRSSRDDVYAYVASLLRDGPAAEEGAPESGAAANAPSAEPRLETCLSLTPIFGGQTQTPPIG